MKKPASALVQRCSSSPLGPATQQVPFPTTAASPSPQACLTAGSPWRGQGPCGEGGGGRGPRGEGRVPVERVGEGGVPVERVAAAGWTCRCPLARPHGPLADEPPAVLSGFKD